MLGYFINYIMIGVLFSFIVDLTTEYARRKGVHVPEHSEWNWQTRILCIWIWPIGVLYFINGFCREYFKNDKNNKKNER